MIKALNLNSPYKVFLNSDNHTYHFVTQNGIKYITYFTDADEYFDNFELKSNIYVFGFDRSRVNENSNVYDESIKVTIIAIIKNFFKNKQNVLIFVADINEDKHRARHRLFNNWKNEFDNLSEFEKYDVEIVTEGEIFYASMIIDKNNPNKSDYKKHFFDESSNLNK